MIQLINFENNMIAILRNKKYPYSIKKVIELDIKDSDLKQELLKNGIKEVNGILFDLGVSPPQLDDASRGFSYLKDAKLDMRMDKSSDFSAYDLVNTYSEKDLTRIILSYGEEKYAKSIAKNIVKKRKEKNIETTFELLDIIKHSMPYKDTISKNPGRRTFQAIRIEVNHELDILDESIRNALSLLKPNGRLCVITFHSLEDKIIKKIFKEVTSVDKLVARLPEIPTEYLPKFKLISDGILPTEKELLENHRSRSSRLRVIERIRED